MSGLSLALHPAMSGPFPAHLEPFLVKIAELVREVFGEDCAKDFWWEESGHREFALLRGTLGNDGHRIKLSITDELTVAIYFRERRSIVEELSRETLRNSSWTDFVGWFSCVKMKFQEVQSTLKHYQVTTRISFFDPTLGQTVRFSKGSSVEVSADLCSIRKEGSQDWVRPQRGDPISSIRRAIDQRWLVESR